MINEPITFPWTLTVYELSDTLWIHHSKIGFVQFQPVSKCVVETLAAFANGTTNGVREVLKHNPKASIAWDVKIKMIKALRSLFTRLDVHAGKVLQEFILEGKKEDESGRQIVFWMKSNGIEDTRKVLSDFNKIFQTDQECFDILVKNTEDASDAKLVEFAGMQGFRVNN
jgi:hypothetical protein